MKRDMHANSLAAWQEGRLELFTKRERDILGALTLEHGARATDRTLMLRLGFTDPNKVRPRITELIAAGVLEEIGTEIDPISGKSVRVVSFVAAAEQQIELFEMGGVS